MVHRQVTVVLADDNDVYRVGLSRVIDSHPELELLEAVADGFDAVEAIQRWNPDVALLDWRMPNMDGLAVCDEVRMRGFDHGVVIISGEMDASLDVRARDVGADASLDKSASRREICATLVRAAPEVHSK